MISVNTYLINMNLTTERCGLEASSTSHLFIYLFIYLFLNFAKRPGSLTERAPLRGPKKRKRKITDTTNHNDNTSETTEQKNGNAKTEWGGHR